MLRCEKIKKYILSVLTKQKLKFKMKWRLKKVCILNPLTIKSLRKIKRQKEKLSCFNNCKSIYLKAEK